MVIVLPRKRNHKGTAMTVEETMESNSGFGEPESKPQLRPSPEQQAAVVEAAYILEAVRK